MIDILVFKSFKNVYLIQKLIYVILFLIKKSTKVNYVKIRIKIKQIFKRKEIYSKRFFKFI